MPLLDCQLVLPDVIKFGRNGHLCRRKQIFRVLSETLGSLVSSRVSVLDITHTLHISNMIVNFKVSVKKQNLFPVGKIGERILSEETMDSECCILANISRVSINVLNKFQVRSSLEATDVECVWCFRIL